MDIGIIGAGRIGATLATLLVAAGHEVAIANSRGPDSLSALVAKLGPRLHAATVAQAAAFGELAVEAIPFGRFGELPVRALAGRILISASNYFPGRDGDIDLAGRTDTELVQLHLPDTRVVKAFNTIRWLHLRDQGSPESPLPDRRAIFLAGDDEGAKRAAARLIDALGFGPVDTGSLRHGGALQSPGGSLFDRELTVREAVDRLSG